MSGVIQEEKQEPEIINVSEESIKALLVKLRTLKVQKDVAIGSLLLHLQELQDEIHVRALPYDHESEVIVAEIKSLMPVIAHSMQTEHGKVSYRKGYTKVTWDNKALDTVCASREDIKAVILPYRRTTAIEPSVSIDIY